MLPNAAPLCVVDEFAEAFEPREEPPLGFKVKFRYAGCAPAPAEVLTDAYGSGTDEAADLRRRIDRISKKAVQERRESEALLRSLKLASKQGSRDLYNSLSKMETNVNFLLREGKRVASNHSYWWRKKVHEVKPLPAVLVSASRHSRFFSLSGHSGV